MKQAILAFVASVLLFAPSIWAQDGKPNGKPPAGPQGMEPQKPAKAGRGKARPGDQPGAAKAG
ncbi:MAG: hypothetical protein LW697_07810, partial [Blastopirellula sp.]|nr:hypothetical protein [Blastopirellula sp.]